MSEARFGRFPPVSGPYGWAGAALLLAALACEADAVFALMAAAFNNDLGQALPWFIVFLVSLPLFAAGGLLWRLGGKRAGTTPASREANDQRQPLLGATAVIALGSVLGFDGFLYLAFGLRGSHRLAFALAALFLGTAISDLGALKLYEILRVRLPSRFPSSRKRALVFFAAFATVERAFLSDWTVLARPYNDALGPFRVGAGTLECGHSSQQTSQPSSQCENPA